MPRSTSGATRPPPTDRRDSRADRLTRWLWLNNATSRMRRERGPDSRWPVYAGWRPVSLRTASLLAAAGLVIALLILGTRGAAAGAAHVGASMPAEPEHVAVAAATGVTVSVVRFTPGVRI